MPPPPPDVVPDDAIVASDPVGKIDGSFSVTSTGTASYSVPLDVPAGRAGMSPTLSLQYDSAGGNGLVGVGFSLSGFSSITRCRRTVAHDGRAAPIDFLGALDEGRLCLDGERLVHVRNSAEYSTERDPFQRVVPLDPDRLGPTRFRVYTRDGRILEYGGPRDARLEGSREIGWASGLGGERVRLSWAISRVEDRSGNWMSFEYSSVVYVDGAVEQRPERISYTGGPSGVAPSRRIVLLFEHRPDTWDGYVAGLHLRTTQRLFRIEAWAPDGLGAVTPARAWELDYRNDSVTGRSLVRELRECDGAGVCKPGTQFDWELGSQDHDRIDTGITDVARPVPDVPYGDVFSMLTLADVDGDARSDLFYAASRAHGGSDAWFVRLAAGGAFGERSRAFDDTTDAYPFPAERSGNPYPFWFRPVWDGRASPQFLDFDGDGDDELLGPFPGDQWRAGPSYPWVTRRSLVLLFDWRQQHLAGADTSQFVWGFPELPRIADLDGNGAQDIVLQDERAPVFGHPSSRWLAAFVADTPVSIPPWQRVAAGSTRWSEVQAVDIDDDGTAELLEPNGASTHLGVWVRPHEATRDQVVDLEPSDCRMWADLNGDGLRDSVILEGGAPRVRLNSGRGFVTEARTTIDGGEVFDAFNACPRGPAWRSPVRPLDFDGDGREDLLDVSLMAVLLSRGPVTSREAGTIVQAFRFELRYLPLGVDGSWGKPPTPLGWSRTAIGDVDGNGLPDIVQVERRSDGEAELRVYRRRGKQPDLLTGVTDGLGAQLTIEHTTLRDSWVYTPGSDCSYPVRCIRGGGHTVVRAFETDDGVGGRRHHWLHYWDARMDVAGQGWLGFGRRTSTNVETGAVVDTVYGNRHRVDGFYPYAGTVESETSYVRDPSTGLDHVRATRNVMAHHLIGGGVAYVTELLSSASAEYELRGFDGAIDDEVPLRRWSTTYGYDEWENPTFSATTSSSGAIEETHTTYENRADTWLLGLPVEVRHTSTSGGRSETIVRTNRFDAHGQLQREDEQPSGGADQHAWTTYVRGADGLIEQVSLHAQARAARTTQIAWDAERVHPRSITDPAGHVTTTVVHPALGVPVVTIDENGVEQRARFDGFGRLREEIAADGTWIRYRFLRGSARVETSTGATADVTQDVLGRPLRDRWQDGDGRTVVVDREFDPLGRLHRITRPRFEGAEPVWVGVEHDILGRPTQVPSARMDGVETLHYEGLEVRMDDVRGTERIRREDADGRIVEVEEPGRDGERLVTHLRYGPFGRLETITDPGGNVTRYGWDTLGRLVGYESPDTGVRTAEYDAFGEMRTQTDAERRVTTFFRDVLGRPVVVTGPDGTGTYVWDSAAHGVGALSRAQSPDGVVTDLTYDELARPSSTTTTVRDAAGRSNALRVGYAYDESGRLGRIDYPDAGGLHPFSVYRSYDARGRLSAVHLGTPETRADLVWEAELRDAEEHVVAEVFGNDARTDRTYDPANGFLTRILTSTRVIVPRPDGGIGGGIGGGDTGGIPLPHYLQWLEIDHDPHGHVSETRDLVEGRTETFGYDALDRLSSAQIAGEAARSFRYDRIGNLTSHEGVEQRYDGVGPHALTSAGDAHYTWDAQGRQLRAPGRRIDWTSFDLPRSVWRGPNELRTDYQYDALQQRVRQWGDGREVLYVPGLYERRDEAGVRTHVWHVEAEGRVVAQVSWQEAAVDDHVVYLHHDQIGSTVLATDEAGNEVHRTRYRPFGRQVSEPGATDPSLTIGFGGHEEDDPDDLVNFGGRLYDPSVGRFLTPDPVLATPFASEALDRYAFVFNDPVTRTDPSGFQSCTDEDPCNEIHAEEPSEFESVTRAHRPDRSGGGTPFDHGAREAAVDRLIYGPQPTYSLEGPSPQLDATGLNVIAPTNRNTQRGFWDNGLAGNVYDFSASAWGQGTADAFTGAGDAILGATVIAASPILLLATGAISLAGGPSPLVWIQGQGGMRIDEHSWAYVGGNIATGLIGGIVAGGAETAAVAESAAARAAAAPLNAAERTLVAQTIRRLRILIRFSVEAVESGNQMSGSSAITNYRRFASIPALRWLANMWRGNAYQAEFFYRVGLARDVGALSNNVVTNSGLPNAARNIVQSFFPLRPDVRLGLAGGREVVVDLTARSGHVGKYLRPFVVGAYDLFYGFIQ